MENWIKRFFLSLYCVATFSTGQVSADSATPNIQAEVGGLIKPDVVPVAVNESLIDSENFELGGFFGVMHIEDFESEFITGVRLYYHLSERFAFEFNYGMTEAGQTSYEQLAFVRLLSNEERDYSYYNFGLNFKVPGESYMSPSYVLNNNLLFNLGMGTTEFAGDKRLTGVFGVGYQLLINDWLALQISAKEHLYKVDLLGPEKLTYNSEYTLGLSMFF